MPRCSMDDEKMHTYPRQRSPKSRQINCIHASCHCVILALLAGAIGFQPRFPQTQSRFGIGMIVILLLQAICNAILWLGSVHKLPLGASQVASKRYAVLGLYVCSGITITTYIAYLSLAAHGLPHIDARASAYAWLILAFIDLPIFCWAQMWLFLRPCLGRSEPEHLERPSSQGSSELSATERKGDYALTYEHMPHPPPAAILRSTTTTFVEERTRPASLRNSLQDYLVTPTIRLLHKASFRSETTTIAELPLNETGVSISHQDSFNRDYNDQERQGFSDLANRSMTLSQKASYSNLSRLETIPDNGPPRDIHRAASQTFLMSPPGSAEPDLNSLRQSTSTTTLVPSRHRSDSTSTLQSHIHPLFRTDSPLPPPAASPGTIFTASPWGGHVCDPDQALSLTRPQSSNGGVPTPGERSPLAPRDRNRSMSSLRSAAKQGNCAGSGQCRTASATGPGLRSVRSEDGMSSSRPVVNEVCPPLPTSNALGIDIYGSGRTG